MNNKTRKKDKIMLTSREVIERLKISNKTLSFMRKKGLPYYKMGINSNSGCRYFWSEIVEWISEGKRKYNRDDFISKML
ncbi:MAG: hypothetical protein JXA60_05220 [Candidatus Coatesbacteria bacterium]|nr:hypothetical protein [Candidatus Coatesbacteria bacterium]